jgi:hypothetical protein
MLEGRSAATLALAQLRDAVHFGEARCAADRLPSPIEGLQAERRSGGVSLGPIP